ncbi:MAG TPA: acyl-CoA dehydrogenase family protein [Solirubrobacteraceae bacterium]|nr:acyl-CoA dehydrogenase family protein [Solirubrobacteraceae bacterium]
MSGLLEREREVMERYLPGLDEQLANISLEDLEKPDTDAIELFRKSGGPALLVPKQHGGLGATPLEAARIQRAIGARAPSLAVATTMHHFSVATLVGMDEDGNGFEWMLLEGITEGSHLVASGFAEGTTGQGIFKPSMTARKEGDCYLVSGSKRPCSLSRSMDLLTASVEIIDDSPETTFAVAVIAADLPGIEIKPFWTAPVLTGAQSDAVILTDVPVDEQLVVESGTVDDGHLDTLQAKALLWFEMLMTSSYLGMATALVERMLLQEKGDPTLRTLAAAELDAAVAGIESVAYAVAEGQRDNRTLARALSCRYAAQDAINRTVASAIENLGGMAFIGSPDVVYLASASRALALHPPSRTRALKTLASGLLGDGLEIQ